MEKKIFILSFIFLAIGIASFSQSVKFEWAGEVAASLGWDEEGLGIAVDKLGNAYTVGYYKGTADFDPGPGVYNITCVATSNDAYVVKLDSAGNFVWAKSFGGINSDLAECVATDTLGNVYVAGTFIGTADFDPGASVFNMTSASVGQEDIFIVKLDAAGNFVWAKRIGGTYDERAFAITTDRIGNVFVTGYFRFIVDFDPNGPVYDLTGSGWYDCFILKLDGAGNFVWASKMGGSGYDYSYALAVDTSDNVYSTGYYEGTADFDPGAGVFNLINSGAGFDVFISKLDASGNFVWAKSVGCPGVNDDARSIALDPQGNVYVAGSYPATGDFDPGAGVVNLSVAAVGITDQFILKLDNAGNYVWVQAIHATSGGYSTPEAMTVDDYQNVYLSGRLLGLVDFDPGAGVSTLLCSGGSYNDFFISKYDGSGNYLWAYSFGAAGADYGYGIALDGSGNIYTTGVYTNTVDFDPSPSAAFSLTAPGSNEGAFVLKLSQATVWPGDTDRNNIVNNNDLLPIGLYFGQTGPARASVSNSWQEYAANNWSGTQVNGSNVKHVDCNGDGIIDNNDTLAVQLNFSQVHSILPTENETRQLLPDLYFVTSSSSYSAGSIIDAEVWVGTSSNPVSNLYGIAFDINYDAALVEPVSEIITYPISWLGTVGTNAISIEQTNALANTSLGAITRIDYLNVSGFGKIATFQFQLKNTISTLSSMHLSFSGYQANDAAGAPVLFNTIADSIVAFPVATSLDASKNNETIEIYPNPFASKSVIRFNEEQKNIQIKVTDIVGKQIELIQFSGKEFELQKNEKHPGIYFIQILKEGHQSFTRKIIIQ